MNKFLALLILFVISCSNDKSLTTSSLNNALNSDTESFDSDTPPSEIDCTDDTKCSGSSILKCSDNKWSSYKTCATTETCQEYGKGVALCIDNSNPASALTLTLRSKTMVPPAGVRAIFSIRKDNGLPISKLKDITVINNETGKAFTQDALYASYKFIPPLEPADMSESILLYNLS